MRLIWPRQHLLFSVTPDLTGGDLPFDLQPRIRTAETQTMKPGLSPQAWRAVLPGLLLVRTEKEPVLPLARKQS